MSQRQPHRLSGYITFVILNESFLFATLLIKTHFYKLVMMGLIVQMEHVRGNWK